jgi:hypothetical protein
MASSIPPKDSPQNNPAPLLFTVRALPRTAAETRCIVRAHQQAQRQRRPQKAVDNA